MTDPITTPEQMREINTCTHERGDWIDEMAYWVCADCFVKLESRPRRYAMLQPLRGTKTVWIGPLQYIAWEAETAAADGVKFNDFLRAMARRFMVRTRPHMDRADAYELAIDVLKSLGDRYGDPAYDWSLAGAREFADMEMDYWETPDDCTN